jgi:hypothetical protein
MRGARAANVLDAAVVGVVEALCTFVTAGTPSPCPEPSLQGWAVFPAVASCCWQLCELQRTTVLAKHMQPAWQGRFYSSVKVLVIGSSTPAALGVLHCDVWSVQNTGFGVKG